jgi:cobalt-zinc-cadmium efflux system membrane fusion protein
VKRRLSLMTLLTVAVGVLWAHEGHAPLPTRGVQVDLARGHLLLTATARGSLAVSTADVELKPVEGRLLAYANVELPWTHHGFATSRLPGRIVGVRVTPGQSVRPGDTVAELKSLELDTLQLEALTAETERALAEKVLKDYQTSAGSNTVPVQTVIEWEAKQAHAQNVLTVARSKWLALGLSADEFASLLSRGTANADLTLPVRVPVGGTVIHAEVSLGKVVEPTEHLAEVADLSSVWVRVGVLEKDLHRVTIGTPVDVQFVARPNETVRTTVAAIAPYLDPITHLVSVWAELKNPVGGEPRFLPGMAGRADIILPAGPPRLTVPVASVAREGFDRFVFVEEAKATASSEYRKTSVTTGRRRGDRVEILAGGLFPGDRVVVNGAHELSGLFAPQVLRLNVEAERSVGLKVEAASAGPVDTTISLDGAIDLPPADRGSASPPLPGVIASIRTDRGRTVRAGEILAEIVSPDLQTFQFDLIRATLDLRLESDMLARIRSIESIPRRRLWESESRVVTLEARVASLRQKLTTVGFDPPAIDRIVQTKIVESALPVRSPVNGVVVTFDKSLGQAVTANEVLFAVHDGSHPRVRGFVSERDVDRIQFGQVVRVRLLSDPSAVWTGRVARSDRTFGTDSRALTVWVELDPANRPTLVHGQLANLTVVTATHPKAVTVPLSAVTGEPGAEFVFIRKPDGVFERRAVEWGIADDRRIEIVRGLDAGQPVAIGGVAELVTGFASLR